MRTSHLAIKKRITEIKSKLTDEQLFASRQFAAYLTDIAEATAGRYHRTVKVSISWDPRAEAGVARTDNKIIELNAGNRLTQSFPTRPLKADSLIGLTGHEVGHMLYTDFKMLELYHQTLTAGRFYPEEPTPQSPKEIRNLDSIRKALEESDQAVLQTLQFISKNLTNIMEDVYIEARLCESFAGTFKTGILLNNFRFAEDMPSVQEEIAASHHEVIVILNMICQYAKTGDINNLGSYKGPLLDALYECIPYIDDASYDDDARARYRSANQMLIILWPFMKSLIEKTREDIKNGTGHALAEAKGQTASSSSMPSGTGGPVAGGSGRYSPTGNDGDINELKQVVSHETGRMELEKTDDIDEGEDGGTVYDSHYAGSGYVSQAEADMQRISTELAEEAAYVAYEKELADELQQEADAIRYGNAHHGIRVHVNRMSYVREEYMSTYRKVAPPLLLISKRLQKQVSQILRDRKEGGKIDSLPMGKKINARNAVRGDGRIFYKMKLPDGQTDIAVAVINDESGSMSSKDRITHARSASIILHDFCKSLEIPTAIYGHTECGSVELYAYAEFDSIDSKDHFRLMDMSARNGNRDGAAIRFVAERLLTRTEQVKLLFIISDGQPAADGYYGTEAEADLRGIKQEYTKKGIQVIAAAIGDDKPNIKRIYQDSFLDITDLNKLPASLCRLIIQHIRSKTA